MKNKLIPLVFILIFSINANATITICFWNLHDFGKSKSEVEIDFIANTIKTFDIIAIQEVVASEGGAQAVARLADALNRKGAKWDYAISDPTSSSAYKAERYAYIWKPGRVLLFGNPWLEKRFSQQIDREPFLANFKVGNDQFTLVNFHAITKSMQPETEIKYFKFFQEEYPSLNLIFSGDFNCPQSHSVFNPLKKVGYMPIIMGQKTSLRKNCISNECLASEFDNIFFNNNHLQLLNSGVILFYKSFINF